MHRAAFYSKLIFESGAMKIGELAKATGTHTETIRYYERDITYRELDEQSSRVAGALHRLGVRKGDRVCLLMDNAPEFYYAYFGIIKIGGIAGPVNCWWQTGEIQYLLNDSGAVALSLIHISEPPRLLSISYAVFCLKKKHEQPTN